jgi:WD40 repeat protein
MEMRKVRLVVFIFVVTLAMKTSAQEVVIFPQLGHSNAIHSAAFSPDGRRIVSASQDSTVKVWDAETGMEVRTFSGHTGNVNSAAFSPDGIGTALIAKELRNKGSIHL